MAVATESHRDFLIPDGTALGIADNGCVRHPMHRVYSFVCVL